MNPPLPLDQFQEFPKLARLSRDCIISEKMDGTNACVVIAEDGTMRFGSRSRWITPEEDNYGFARWATANKEELMKLGPGRHFGEWWGQGIQRGYGLKEKHFSLFNTIRWEKDERPACCYIVPIIWKGLFNEAPVNKILSVLKDTGSHAVPGFMRPEGIVIYHVAGNVGFKKTIEKDEQPKSTVG